MVHVLAGGNLSGMAMSAYLPSPPINSFHIGPLAVHFYALAYLDGIAAAMPTRYASA